jgi:hypothetical protein
LLAALRLGAFSAGFAAPDSGTSCCGAFSAAGFGSGSATGSAFAAALFLDVPAALRLGAAATAVSVGSVIAAASGFGASLSPMAPSAACSDAFSASSFNALALLPRRKGFPHSTQVLLRPSFSAPQYSHFMDASL